MGIESKSLIDKSNFEIWVVEDDQGLNKLIQKKLQRNGFHTKGMKNGKDVISNIDNVANIMLLLDYKLPDMNANELITKLKEMDKEVPFIVMTGYGDEKIAVEMMKLGALDYIVKEQDFINIVQLKVKKTTNKLFLIEEKPVKIIVVEDDEGLNKLIQKKLKRNGFITEGIKNGKDVISKIEDNENIILLLDYKLPDMNADDLIKKLRETGREVPFIVMTGLGDEKIAVEMMKLGALDYIVKEQDFINIIEIKIEKSINQLFSKIKLLKLENDLFQNRAILKSIIHSPFLSITLLDKSGKILELNEETSKRFNKTYDEMLGENIWDFLPASVTKHRKKQMEEVFKTGEIYFGEDIRGEMWNKYSIIPALKNREGKVEAVIVESLDITNLKKAEENLRESLNATISVIAKILDTRDPYTAEHQLRVSNLALRIAEVMNLEHEKVEIIRVASLIHDIGKISIPAEILGKPTTLTQLEWNFIQRHPVIGYEIIKSVKFPYDIASIVLEHHERLDGSGYPDGKKKDEIHLESKIIAVADVVEAISSHRPYRPALGLDKALEEIKENSGKLYDPEVVEACIKVFEMGYEFTPKSKQII